MKRIGNRKLGQDYRLIIRAYERFSDTYYSDKLKNTWLSINNEENFNLLAKSKRLETEENYEYGNLERDLIAEKRAGLTCNLPDDYESIFVALLEAGIPLGLWSRPHQCSCEFGQLSPEQIQTAEELIEKVFAKRKEAHGYSPDPKSKWGYYLAMLFDPDPTDPNRSPPSQFLRTPGT